MAISGAMNAGVPGRQLGRGGHDGVSIDSACVELHQPEVEHLDEVVVEAHPADVDVGGLDVAVDQSPRVRVGERVADLPQQVDARSAGTGPNSRTSDSRSRPSSSSIT